MKKVIVDLDSTGADIMTPWLAQYNLEYDDDLTPNRILGWDMHKFVKPECGHKIYTMYDRPGFFSDLVPFPGFVQAMKYLHEAQDDAGDKKFQLLIVTASDHDIGAGEKIGWMKKHLPFIDKKERFITHGKHHIAADVFIDDSPNNIKLYFNEHPQAEILTIAWPYNADVAPMCTRFESWKEPARAWNGIVDHLERMPS